MTFALVVAIPVTVWIVYALFTAPPVVHTYRDGLAALERLYNA